MKNALLPLILLTSLKAFAIDSTQTPGGQIDIDDATVQLHKINGQVVNIPIDNDTMVVNVKQVFTNGSTTYILFEQNTGGVACPATYFIYKISLSSVDKRSSSFGTCSDLIKINPAKDRILMNMPNMGKAGNSNYTYQYADDLLLENGKVH